MVSLASLPWSRRPSVSPSNCISRWSCFWHRCKPRDRRCRAGISLASVSCFAVSFAPGRVQLPGKQSARREVPSARRRDAGSRRRMQLPERPGAATWIQRLRGARVFFSGYWIPEGGSTSNPCLPLISGGWWSLCSSQGLALSPSVADKDKPRGGTARLLGSSTFQCMRLQLTI